MREKVHSLVRTAVFTVLFCLAFSGMTVSTMAAAHSTKLNGTDYKLVYDYDYYTSKVTSLKGKSDTAVLTYFVNTGMPRGDQAISSFSPISYRRGNQDLRVSYGKNWTKYYRHYMSTGYKSAAKKATAVGIRKITKPITKYNGTDYSKVYNYEYYIAAHPGVKRAYPEDDVKALAHFVKYGMKAQWQACKSFDVKSYRYANPKLRSLYLDDYPAYYKFYIQHPTTYGGATGVKTLQKPITVYDGIDLSSIFDYKYYTSHNAAVAKYGVAKENNDAAALAHFVKIGIRQNPPLTAKAGAGPGTKAYKNKLSELNSKHPEFVSVEYSKAMQYTSSTNYMLIVNRSTHKVHVFYRSDGIWSELKVFPCDTGKASTPTVTGSFTLKDKGLYFDSGSARCWYYSRIYRGYLFHSILYRQQSSPRTVLDGRMGVSVSHGCIRLYLSDAKWIYDTVPYGSRVVIYN